MVLEPALASIAPRVISPETGDKILLVDEIENWIWKCEYKTIRIKGEGKTTALKHLKEVFKNNARVEVEDDDSVSEINRSLILVVSKPRPGISVELTLAKWDQDDFIEYLLNKYPQSCASVMKRLERVDKGFANGSPHVWSIILDRMAENEWVQDIERAVLSEIFVRFGNLKKCDKFCDHWIENSFLTEKIFRAGRNPWFPQQVKELLKFDEIPEFMFAERFARRLNIDPEFILNRALRSRFLRIVAKRLFEVGDAKLELSKLFRKAPPQVARNSAMLLFYADSSWRPKGRKKNLNLRASSFAGAKWPKLNLIEPNFSGATFCDSDFSNSRLDRANLFESNFCGADLSGAKIPHCNARRSVFGNCDLSRCDASHGEFPKAHFAEANLANANFENSILCEANLDKACLRGTNFSKAFLDRATLRETILHETNFNATSLVECNFSTASIDSTTFQNANLVRTTFEDCKLLQPSFRDAILRDAILIGSRIVSGCLANAVLIGAKMAKIDWAHCDLRGADFRECTFHMGSCRSGLVDSPYPSHGTRTGFYTEDLNELYFKRPEEIRKANLCGVDLRGADIEGVDFYLVDLRGTKLDPAQEAWVRKTGAILSDIE